MGFCMEDLGSVSKLIQSQKIRPAEDLREFDPHEVRPAIARISFSFRTWYLPLKLDIFSQYFS